VCLDFGCVQRYDDNSRQAFKEILHAISSGKRGIELWSVIEEKLLIPPGTSESLKDIFLEYLLFVMEPLLAPQPFRFSRVYTSKVSEYSVKMKRDFAKQFLNIRWREPKREGLAPLVRILFGLCSLLAALEAEGDWRSLSLKA
jgi:hypothetical protein